MTTITGRINAGNRAVRGVLIEAFHTPGNFQKHLPLKGRNTLSEHQLKRLGSAISNTAGEFTIQYDPDKIKGNRNKELTCINLWVIASACCKSDEDLTIIYQAGDVRQCAAEIEQYIICLSESYTDVNNINGIQPINPTPETIKKQFVTQNALQQAHLEVAKEKFAKRTKIREEFQSKVATKIRQQLSLVELDDKGKPLDPEFVKADEPVQKKAEQRIISAISENLDSALDDDKKVAFHLPKHS